MEINSPEPAILSDEKPLYDSVLALYTGYVTSTGAAAPQPPAGDTATYRNTLQQALQRLSTAEAAIEEACSMLDAAVCITPQQFRLLRKIIDATAATPAQERSLEPHRAVPAVVFELLLATPPREAFQLHVLDALVFRGPCDPSFVAEAAFAEVLLHHETLDEAVARRLLDIIHMARDVSCERDFLSGIFLKELQHGFDAERSGVADDLALAAGRARLQGYGGESRLDMLGESLHLLYDTDSLTAEQARSLRQLLDEEGEDGVEFTQAFRDILRSPLP
jgi:hypothetical protein